MPAKVFSAATVGLDAQFIEVEVEASYGLPRFNIVGLPDKAVEESKERVAAAIKSIGLKPPYQNWRVLVNLAPADLKKEGSLYDLPIALGFLLSSKQINFDPQKQIFIGELALDGKLRPIKGAISFAMLAKEMSYRQLVLPQENAAEATLIDRTGKKLKIIAAQNLAQVISYVQAAEYAPGFKIQGQEEITAKGKDAMDFAWIKGQRSAKRALEIAAAGGHNILMQGPPGGGKTLLAKALPSILPRLSFEESLEITKIYSVAGALPKDRPLIKSRPFRSPHHTTSEVALIGGGNPPQPGEITLAHRGVLFLDEWPEFHRDVLESLRQPIEDGEITILRSRHRLILPANFMLVAATNPCPCGYKNDPERKCSCTSSQISKYQRKLSGPLMDRLDLFVNVPQVKYEKLALSEGKLESARIRQNIEGARALQKERFSQDQVNSEMQLPQIKKYCQIDSKSNSTLRKFVDSGKLSARGYHRVLKVARTIADLDNSEKILHNHVSEGLMYKMQNKEN